VARYVPQPDDRDQSWHDFADVDAILCAHHAGHLGDPLRKPATKLVNAWVAGCVPLAERAPAYLELGTDEQEVVFLEHPTDCFTVLDRLNSDPAWLASIERKVVERGREFSVEQMSRRWLDALQEAADAAETTAWRRSTRMVAVTEKRLAHAAHEILAATRRRVQDRSSSTS
jgi:hypothetical protein